MKTCPFCKIDYAKEDIKFCPECGCLLQEKKVAPADKFEYGSSEDRGENINSGNKNPYSSHQKYSAGSTTRYSSSRETEHGRAATGNRSGSRSGEYSYGSRHKNGFGQESGKGQYSKANSSTQPYMQTDPRTGKRKVSFYEAVWFIILCVFCCWPVAIVLLIVRVLRDNEYNIANSGTSTSAGTGASAGTGTSRKAYTVSKSLTGKKTYPAASVSASDVIKVAVGVCLILFGLLFAYVGLICDPISEKLIGVGMGLAMMIGGGLPIYLLFHARYILNTYESLIDNRGNTKISFIAEKLGKDKKKVRTKLQSLISRGFLSEPENNIAAYINGKYDLVVMTQNGKPIVPVEETMAGEIAREKEAKRSAEQKKTAAERAERMKNAEAEEKILLVITDSIGQIYDQEMKEYVERIGRAVNTIKTCLEENPEDEEWEDIKNMRSYYIPTTINMINKYLHPITSAASKETIKNGMDTVVNAFENIEGKLMKKQDVETEIDVNVFKQKLARDGLLDSDFDLK